ncbi:MAG: integration host factor subunit beta [Candidatus Hydrothermota bacterium]|nr:integration host factor subunit beta [Candidatus Hydrothermae bacterium]RKY98384.1 MAG: integration host factor subunit beta [Candidatus Hydrothermae bacterium]
MRKQDIVDKIYEETGLPKKDIMIVVNSFLETMKEAFKAEERIELRGFGVFEVKRRKPRIGRNPRTKEEVKIPARKVITFKPSKLIKVIKEER